MTPKRTLVVLIRGWANKPDLQWYNKNMKGGRFPDAFEAFVKDVIPGATVLRPELDMAIFSNARPAELVQNVLRDIDAATADTDYDRIVLAGFSTGGLLARAVMVRAKGILSDGDFHPNQLAPRPWADKVDRVIFLSGILRGWSISSESDVATRIAGPAFMAAVGLVSRVRSALRGEGHRPPLIAQIERGQPFVVNTRLLQIAFEDLAADRDDIVLPEVISVLGAQDEVVSPVDCLEFSPHPGNVFLEVPGTNHMKMLHLDGDDPDTRRRRHVLAQVFGADIAQVRAMTDYLVETDDLNDYFDELDRPHVDLMDSNAAKVKDAVIVLHGIRDHGYWTKRIAKSLKRRGARALMRAPSPSYGYFTVLDFINKRRRQAQARWLAQQFADIRACYRTADISFVGHSNGTYLLKAALDMCPAMELKRVYLAGSVLRTDLDWGNYAGQIKCEVLNVRADADMVVARLPGAMERMGLDWLDVGGAGYNGFAKTDPHGVDLIQRMVPGNHKAAVAEPSWPAISDFIVDGKVLDGLPDDAPLQRPGTVRAAPAVLAAGCVVAVFAVALVALGLAHGLPALFSGGAPAQKAAATTVILQLAFAVAIIAGLVRLARKF